MKYSRLNTKTLTTSAVLIALGVVLSFLRIPLSALTEITLTGLPIAAGSCLFGPWIGFLIGVLIDLCGYFIRPTGPFFPGFTLSSGLVGLIYGLFLFQKWWERKVPSPGLLRSGTKGLVIRILLGHLAKTVLISLLLNCFWLSVFYGLPFKAVFLGSLPKEAINFPIETFLIYVIIKGIRLYMK